MGEPPCKKSRAEELTCTEKDKGLYNETDIEERIQESEDVTFRVSCRLSVRQGRFCNPQVNPLLYQLNKAGFVTYR